MAQQRRVTVDDVWPDPRAEHEPFELMGTGGQYAELYALQATASCRMHLVAVARICAPDYE